MKLSRIFRKFYKNKILPVIKVEKWDGDWGCGCDWVWVYFMLNSDLIHVRA